MLRNTQSLVVLSCFILFHKMFDCKVVLKEVTHYTSSWVEGSLPRGCGFKQPMRRLWCVHRSFGSRLGNKISPLTLLHVLLIIQQMGEWTIWMVHITLCEWLVWPIQIFNGRRNSSKKESNTMSANPSLYMLPWWVRKSWKWPQISFSKCLVYQCPSKGPYKQMSNTQRFY